MSALLLERIRTALQDPRTHGDSVQRERLQEVTRLRRLVWDLRRENERWQVVVAGYRELLDGAEPCPSCVAKGE